MKKNILRNSYIYLILVLSVAYIFRLIILLNSSLTFFSDDAIYAALARNLINLDWNHFIHPTWPPLFPFFSAIIYLIIQNWESSLRLVSIISGVILLIPLFILVKKSLSTLHAILFTITISFFAPILYLSILPLSDTLFTTLVTSSITTMFFAIQSKTNRLFFLAAFLFGMSYLTRPEGSMFFSISIAYLFLIFSIRIIFLKLQPYSSLFMIPIMIGVFLITVSPFLITLRSQLDEWTISAKFAAQIQQGHAFALVNHTTWAQEVTSISNPNYASTYFRNGFNYLLDHEYYLRHLFKEKLIKWEYVFLRIFPLWSVIPMLFGLINVFLSKHISSNLYLVFVMSLAIPLTIFSTAVAETRYLLWTIPLLSYFYYQGVNFCLSFLKFFIKSKTWFRYYKLTAFIPFGLSIFFPAIDQDMIFHPVSKYSVQFTKNHYRPQFQEIAEFMQTHKVKLRPKIMMKHEMVEFYSNGYTVYLPETTYDNLIKYAHETKIDYLIAWEPELRLDKNLNILLNSNEDHPELKLVYKSHTPEGIILIYTLLTNESRKIV